MKYDEIIKKYGTPTYVFDSNTVIKRINYLRSKLDGLNLIYAVKANTFIAKEIEDAIDGYEICSPGEFAICHKLKINSQKMVISGVYKEESVIESMMSNNDIGKYTVESLNQWNLLNKVSKKLNKKINVLIRLTSGNQFGVCEQELKTLIQSNDNDLITIMGIEYFSGTQKHSLKRITKEIEMLHNLVSEIENDLHFEIKEIEYGPGFPIFYFQDEEFDEEEFLTEFRNIMKTIDYKKVSLELGRSIAASSGSYLTKVVDLKENKNGKFALVDGGIHHLVYYGQTMAMRIPYFEILPKKDVTEDTYNIYGSLCTINDALVKNLKVPCLEINDIFIFKNVGAYSMTEGISLFLSRDLPKVVLVDKQNNIKLVRDTIKTSDINFPNYESEE